MSLTSSDFNQEKEMGEEWYITKRSDLKRLIEDDSTGVKKPADYGFTSEDAEKYGYVGFEDMYDFVKGNHEEHGGNTDSDGNKLTPGNKFKPRSRKEEKQMNKERINNDELLGVRLEDIALKDEYNLQDIRWINQNIID